MFGIEQKFIKKGYSFLIGVDEAGRGPLAGPVVAAAVGIESNSFFELVKNFRSRIDDSKKLKPAFRVQAYNEILKTLKVGIGLCEPGVIDKINILEATKLTMVRSISYLKSTLVGIEGFNTCILIDGRIKINIPSSFFNIPGGDNRCFLISCASIVAKVVRDEVMLAYDSIYPEYKFCKHKGYGTKQHMLAIKKYGLTPIHRRTFSPCKLESNYE